MIVWAVDPFLGDENLNVRAANLVALVIRSGLRDERVLPITVLSPEQLNWPEAFQGEWETKFREAVRQRLTDFIASPIHRLSEFKDRVEEPLLISQALPSVRQSAADLLAVAESEGARLIVASTVARPRAARWVIGSFCEALMSASKIPVLTVNPDTVIPQEIENVHLASDLQEDDRESRLQVTTAAEWSKAFSSALTLEHRLLAPIPPMLEPGLAPAPLPLTDIQAYYEADREQKSRTADRWCRETEQITGVHCESKFVTGVGSLTESLATAMSPDTSSVAMISSGYSARELIRHSKIPVLVLPRLHQ